MRTCAGPRPGSGPGPTPGRPIPLHLLRAGFLVVVVGLAAGCADGKPTGPGEPPATLALSLSPAPTSGAEARALDGAFDRVDRFRVTVHRVETAEVAADTLIRVTPGRQAYALAVEVELTAERERFRVLVVALDGEVELFRATGEVEVSGGGGEAGTSVVRLPVRYTGPGIRAVVTDPAGGPVEGAEVELLRDGAPLATERTDPEGVALFPGLAAGVYTLRPRAAPGSFYCPGSRSVSLPGTDAAVEVTFRGSAFACTVRVLLLSGGDVDHNASLAAAFRDRMEGVEVEGFFYLNELPDLPFLGSFDVVLLYEDGVFGGSAELGDRVAEYVRSGGNVVFGTFYWQNRSDGPFDARGWGALEELDPFESRGGAVYRKGTLDPASLVPHPLTTGVTSLQAHAYWGGVAARSGTTVVASWSDGTPLAGYRTEAGGQRLVALSLFPGYAVLPGVSGDFYVLWENALRWAGSGGRGSTAGAPGS